MGMKKTLLIGNFGSGNIGDELILCAALDELDRRDERSNDREVVVMTADEEWTRSFVEDENLECVPFFPAGGRSYLGWLFSASYRRKLLGLRGDVDQIIFCGGGLFAIKAKACWIWSKVFWWCKKIFPEAEIRLENQGVDKGLDAVSNRLTQRVFDTADFISVRDRASGEALRELGIKNYELIGDRVEVWLKSDSEKAVVSKEKKILLLNAVSRFDQKKYSRVQKLYKNYEFKFVLMDPLDERWIPLGFKGEVIILRNKRQVFELWDSADVAIGERLHFVILSQAFLSSENTFLLKDGYSEKVKSFGEKYGVGVFGR